jgi:uncharacterized protein YbjT (DUF2867 family)
VTAAGVAVVGAAGQTGRRVVGALSRQGAAVRAVVRDGAQAERVPDAASIAVADLTDAAGLTAALDDAAAVYYIPPAFAAQEVAFGSNVISAALAVGLPHLVYHSVLHAPTPAMPHHRRKAEVELALRESPLAWTILQPAIYAQTALQFLDLAGGQLNAPFDPRQPFSPVDLEDLAEAAVRVLLEDGHAFATYELAGPDRIGLAGMGSTISGVLGRSISIQRVAPDVQPDMRAMLDHYDAHGLVGNPNVLRMLLGREPASFAEVMRRELVSAAPGGSPPPPGGA